MYHPCYVKPWNHCKTDLFCIGKFVLETVSPYMSHISIQVSKMASNSPVHVNLSVQVFTVCNFFHQSWSAFSNRPVSAEKEFLFKAGPSYKNEKKGKTQVNTSLSEIDKLLI